MSSFTINNSATSAATFSIAWAHASLEMETEMGEVSFKLDEVVVVEERKLRATYSRACSRR
jgi:hypothetical protein